MDVIIMNKSKKENIYYVKNDNFSFLEYGGNMGGQDTLCINPFCKLHNA